MPQTMPLQQSRERQERVFMLRSVLGLSWRHIAAAEGFSSVGGAQRAYERHRARNAPPDAATALAEILERKRFATGKLATSLLTAKDPRAVAELVRAMTAQDAELAKLYGLGETTVQVNVTDRALEGHLSEVRRLMLAKAATIDAEVLEVSAIEM